MHHTFSQHNILRAGVVFLLLAGVLLGYTSVSAHDHTVPSLEPGSQAEGIRLSHANTITLHPQADAPPVSSSTFDRYGFYMSPPQPLGTPASRITLNYRAQQPVGSALHVDVRASQNGQHWTEWQTSLQNGAAVDFPLTARVVQYRVRLFGGSQTSPVLRDIEVQAVRGYQNTANEGAVAPTFRVRATRQGMIGGRTANGHIIRPRDRFVSLPSWRSLSSRNGHEYQVRITYQGRSAVAPVWDVGPWNTNDSYWASSNRGDYPDLPQGWPQDHAAYYDGHNGGYAEYGYVRFPTAIDVGDGVWWDDLGIHGDQAEVEVTYLWMGHDPMAAEAPSSDPNASEYMVNELGPAFIANETTWRRSPVGCGATKHAFWARTVTSATEATHRAFWQPNLPAEGLYDVYVHVPVCPNDQPTTSQARYLVQHRDGAEEIVVDQTQQTHWVLLGRFPFAAGDEGFVHLTNLGSSSNQTIWFDNAKWVPVRSEGE